MTTVTLPASTTVSIWGYVSSLFSGISPVVIIVIALVFGFWILEIVIGLMSTALEGRHELKAIAGAVETVKKAGYTITEKVPKTEAELELASALRFLRTRGFIVKEL